MKLNRVAIVNYRSIGNVVIDFDLPCRILVGINESGKSNLLHALRHLDPAMIVTPDDVRVVGKHEDPPEEAYIRFIFKLNRRDQDLVLKNSLLSISGYAETPILSKDGKQYTLADFCLSKTEGLFSVDLKKGGKICNSWALGAGWSILPGWRMIRPGGPPVADSAGKEQKLFGPNFKTTIETLIPATPKFINELVSAEINKLTQIDLPTVVFWDYSEKNLLPSEILLSEFQGSPDVCVPLRHMFALAGFENPSETIAEWTARSNGLENLFERIAKKTTDHMRKVWKEMRGVAVELRISGSNIKCFLRDFDNAYDFSRRSDGFKRFFTFLLLISAKAKTKHLRNTLYLHDEPEIGLHPTGARYLRDELIAISSEGDNLVAYSTHSIFMIDRSNPERHLIVKKPKEITEVQIARNSEIAEEEVLYQALGSSIFESIREKNIIFEGYRDKKLFDVATSSPASRKTTYSNTLDGLGKCFADGLKDINRVASLLQLANKEFIVVSDGDAPAKEHQRRARELNPEIAWVSYDDLVNRHISTAEDFITNDYLEKCLEHAINDSEHDLPKPKSCLHEVTDQKLDAIKAWLRTNKLSNDQAKEILGKLKTFLYLDLLPKHIDPTYREFLSALAQKVKK